MKHLYIKFLNDFLEEMNEPCLLVVNSPLNIFNSISEKFDKNIFFHSDSHVVEVFNSALNNFNKTIIHNTTAIEFFGNFNYNLIQKKICLIEDKISILQRPDDHIETSSNDDVVVPVYHEFEFILEKFDLFENKIAVDFDDKIEGSHFVNLVSDHYAFDKVINSEVIYDKYEILKPFYLNNRLSTAIEQFNKLCTIVGSVIEIKSETDISRNVVQPETIKHLRKYWGENAEFRNLEVYERPGYSKTLITISQGEVVEKVLASTINLVDPKELTDLLITAPTGAGKSMLFQLPAFIISEFNLITIVISPLKALMKDQVDSIKNYRKFQKVGFLNSDMSLDEREELILGICEGEIDVIYMSPELFLSYSIEKFIGDRKLGLIVIDEAHLVTTWGRDFRVDYWFLGQHINKLRKHLPYTFLLMALTATAIYDGPNDMVFDTIDSLLMFNPVVYIGKIVRDDISFKFSNYERFGSQFKRNKIEQTADFVVDFVKCSDGKLLVYCPYTKTVQEIASAIKTKGLNRVSVYYGTLDKDYKDKFFTEFKDGTSKVMISTKAFGMGIDISDIDVVYHHAPSGILPDYIQEIGRVARIPGVMGFAALNYNEQDQNYSKVLHGLSAIRPDQLKSVLAKLNLEYSRNNSRNLLLNVDDFQYIFDSNDDLNQKVLTCLMMIEKDYFNKYSQPVLICRPKRLFSVIFMRLNQNAFNRMTNIWSVGVTVIEERIFQNDVLVYVKVDLDAIWQKYFKHISFPSFKYALFNGNVFGNSNQIEYKILMKVEISFITSIINNHALFGSQIDKLKLAIRNLPQGKYWTSLDFVNKLTEVGFNSHMAKAIANHLLSKYSGNGSVRLVIRTTNPSNFNVTYRFNGNNYIREFNRWCVIVQKLLDRNTAVVERYFGHGDPDYDLFLNSIEFLALLDLGTYSILGGDRPMVSVRINGPDRIRRDSSGYYVNDLLNLTYERFKISSSLFDLFFTHKMSDSERWEFIEDYFLGEDVESLEQRFNNYEKLDSINLAAELSSKVVKSGELVEEKVLLEPQVANVSDVGNIYDRKLSLFLSTDFVEYSISEWLELAPAIFVQEYLKGSFVLLSDERILLADVLDDVDLANKLLGLDKNIFPDSHKAGIRAIDFYNLDILKFYIWYKSNRNEIYLTFKQKLVMINHVYSLDVDILDKKDRSLLN